MICRQCPECGSKWYSASTSPWIGDKCGAILGNKHNRPLEEPVGGEYRCILADPPWSYKNKSIRGSARNHYTTLSDEMISGLPVEKLVDNDAFLFLWVTNSVLIKGRHLAVCSSWGFIPKTLITWIKLGSSGKPIMGMGFYTRGATEHLVLARRGRAMRKRKDLLNLIMDKRGLHPQKPSRAYQLIEEFCDGPRLELFARKKRPGWDCWGDEVKSDINLEVGGGNGRGVKES